MLYLDNAATPTPSRAAAEAAITAFEAFGNPSSLHRLGLEAEKLVKGAKKNAAELLGAPAEDIYFTSGGTESNNTAIFGAVYAGRKKHVVTTKIEHPSVIEPMKRLAEKGYTVDFVGVDGEGRLDLDELAAKLCADTALVSVMHVNNETGTIQPLSEVRRLISEKTDGALFHIDAVQSFGKIPIDLRGLKPDLLSASAHKIHGIKGTGLLYCKARIAPLIVGGGQQKNLRSGTENVPGIAAFGAACAERRGADYDRVLNLRQRLLEKIREGIDNVVYNGSDTDFCAYVLNLSLPGIKSEILLHSLEAEGIYVSTGSACSSNKPQPSSTLTAMGKKNEEITGAVRFSFSDEITEEDVDRTAAAVCAQVAKIRRIMR